MSAAAGAVTEALHELHTRFTGLREGRPADCIPQLARSDPDAFGLALISMDGHRYSAGDGDAPFTLQSVSKPFVYALALSVLGLDEVCRWVNAEPSGEAYNAISESRPRETGTVVLDLPQATGIGRVAPLLSSGLGRIAADGVRTAVADPGHLLAPPGPGEPGGAAAVRRFATREEAVAWCTSGTAG
ncbi:glutaminase [Streptomyces gelaticus]